MHPYWRVLAHPGSLQARRELAQYMRMWADWRAELISDSLALRIAEREGRIAQAEKLRTSIAGAIRFDGKTWAGTLAPYVDLDDSFAFGLVARLYVPGDRAAKVLSEAITIAPIQHLVIRPPLTSLDEIVQCTALLQLCTLSLAGFGKQVGDREASLLAGCEYLSELKMLRLDRNNIGLAGVQALAASPHLARAAYIGLEDNPADPTPRAYESEGTWYAERPSLAEELERTHGPRPWLALPDDPRHWPPRENDLAVTDEAEQLPDYVMGPVPRRTMVDLI
jgi:hypothetical protein